MDIAKEADQATIMVPDNLFIRSVFTHKRHSRHEHELLPMSPNGTGSSAMAQLAPYHCPALESGSSGICPVNRSQAFFKGNDDGVKHLKPWYQTEYLETQVHRTGLYELSRFGDIESVSIRGL